MRILFLSENYFPDVSGVPVVVRYLAEGLLGFGHKVSIATSNSKGYPKQETIGGVDVYRFNLTKSYFDRYFGDVDDYVNFVITFDCDVIVFECLMCATTDLILPYINKIEAKTILHSHGISGLQLKPFECKKDFLRTIANTYHWAFYSWYFKCVFPKYIRDINVILCLSEVDNTISYCKKYDKDVQILSNAVEDIFMLPSNPVTQKEIKELGMPYLLSVAYYNQIKNQISILKEFYKSNLKDYAMVFIGPSENEYYYKLVDINKSLRQKYGARTVLFLTHVDRSLIPDIIGNAKLYLVGSTIEQFSIAIIEAMAKGIPFISTNVGNARVLPGGITINNIDRMHSAMLELLSDKKLMHKYSNTGKKYVADCCVREKIVKRLDNIINEV